MTTTASSTPWPLRPFALLWALVAFMLLTVGRIFCALLGLAFMAAGVALAMTVIGAIVGVPLAAFGLVLLARSMF